MKKRIVVRNAKVKKKKLNPASVSAVIIRENKAKFSMYIMPDVEICKI